MNKEKEDKFLAFCLNEHFDITSITSPQRKAVLYDSYSVLPSGAGSGKTTVLTYRFLRLLFDYENEKDRIHSDEILTITFTKAATANMRAKIYLIIKKAVEKGLIDEEELKRFSNAEISTTDSFCSSIVRQDCIRYGISPTFLIEDDRDLNEFVSKTLKDILNDKIEKEEEVEKICRYVSFENLLSAFKTISSSFIDISHPYSSDYKELYKKTKDEVYSIIEDNFNENKDKLRANLISFIGRFSPYTSINDDVKIASQALIAIDNNTDFILAFSKKRSVSENKALSDEFITLRNSIKDEFKTYNSTKKYLDSSSFSILKGYSSLLSEFEKRLIRHKREEGLLTFHDVILLSIDILKTNYSLRSFYNKKFKKIMVDEFQDNNEENKRLVYLLASKETFIKDDYPTINDIIKEKVFMVGDEKQSIYKFRGADVSVFKNISKDFGEERVLPLTQNFRSEKEIIDKINKVFSSSIMPVKGECQEDYEAEYTPLISKNERVKSQISFRYLNAKDSITNNEEKDILTNATLSEAYEVARIIKEEILGSEREKYLVSYKDPKDNKIKTRYPELEDIAILLKKSTNQSSFEKALRLFNIPFNVTDNKSLTMDAVLNDFYSVLQLSVYGLDDTLSFASFLRSPFVNMNDEDIEHIMYNYRSNKELSLNLSKDGLIKLENANKVLTELKEKEKKGSLCSIMDYLWFETGYRFFIESERKNESYTEHFDYLYTIANDYDSSNKGLIELLDRIREKLGDVSDFKDLNVLKEETSGVTIQTIHKSKGLEYPIVFVSDMGGKSNGDKFYPYRLPSSLPLLPYFIDENNKLINPISIVKKQTDNMVENAETKRVLYVAATRSENHLIFTSSISSKLINKNNEITYPKDESYNSMLQYLLKGLAFDLLDKSKIIECKEFFPVYYSKFRESKKREKHDKALIKAWYNNPKEQKVDEEKKKIGVTTLIKDNDLFETETEYKDEISLPSLKIDTILTRNDPKISEEDNKKRKEERITEFGTFVHSLLEHYINNEEEDLSHYFKEEKDREKIIEEGFVLRDNFINSDLYLSIKSFNLFPEKEFYIKDKDYIVEGIIDLLAIKDNEIIIIDFKTDSTLSETKHTNQLNYYKKAISTIYPDKHITSYVFYLRNSQEIMV